MEKYFNPYAISLAVSLLGCVAYTIVATIRCGFQNIQEKDVVIIFADFLAICSSVKIIYMSFDMPNCPTETRLDLIFFALGGLMMLIVSFKNIAAKFKQFKIPG